MGIWLRARRTPKLALALSTTVMGVSLFAATAYGGPYQDLSRTQADPSVTNNDGPCETEGAVGTSAVPLATYTLVCADGQWLVTSLESAGSDRRDGTITRDAAGNTFVSTDGVWVPRGSVRTPPIRVISK
jgi:hypothetical protein